MSIVDAFLAGLRLTASFAWDTWWALVLGFTLTGIVEEFVSEESVTQLLGGDDWEEVAVGTIFGAGSSSCSFTAVATAKALFKKGASAAASLAAFQFASTNLVIELALVMWILLGWQFVLADFVGGTIAIAVIATIYKYTVPQSWFDAAREHLHAVEDTVDPVCGMTVDPENEDVLTLETDGGTEYFCSASCMEEYQSQSEAAADAATGWRDRIPSIDDWKRVARTAIRQWDMLWEDIAVGFLIAGFVGALVPDAWWEALFSVGTEGSLTWVIMGSFIAVLIAVLTFECSVGNVPFATVLWTNGVPFGSVVSFIYGDLIIPPLVNTYRRYYGPRMAAVIFGSVFLAAVIAGVTVHYLFTGLGIVPPQGEAGGTAPDEYTVLLNLAFALLFFVEAYLAFGAEGIVDLVRTLPERAAATFRKSIDACQAGWEVLCDACGAIIDALWRIGEAIRLLFEAVRLAGRSFRLKVEVVLIVLKAPFRVIAAVVRVLRDVRETIRQKRKKARQLRWLSAQKFKKAYRLVSNPFRETVGRLQNAARKLR